MDSDFSLIRPTLRQAATQDYSLPSASFIEAKRSSWSVYEPDINPSYRDLAEHYGVAVLPARSRKPKDKAKVEVGVQVVERWILAVLRNRQFFSLGELNTAIGLLLDRLNQKPFKKLPGSRRSAFETLDQPLLQALPEHP